MPKILSDQASPFLSAQRLVSRSASSASKFFSIVDAAYEAAEQYEQLAKLTPDDLKRRGVANGDLKKHVFNILVRPS
jgi:hypothetical protein